METLLPILSTFLTHLAVAAATGIVALVKRGVDLRRIRKNGGIK